MASYIDPVLNFKQLENTAKYIVRATVVSAKMKSVYAQEAILDVTEIYKGETSAKIHLYQLTDDNLVKEGKEYILFLSPQFPDDLDSQIYYPTGGGIGALEIDDSFMKIYACDDRILDNDLNTWIEINTVQSEKQKYDILIRNE